MRPTRRAAVLTLGAAALAAVPGVGAAAVTADDRSLGNTRARVTMFEYASVTCPHCAAWHHDVWPAFKAKYVDTGKVLFVFREMLTAPADLSAAGFMVARCAPKAKYFDVIGALFSQQHLLASGRGREWLIQAGAVGGLTPAQVQACATDQAGLDALNARMERTGAEHPTVGSTPTFVVNGVVHAGEQSLANLDMAIADAMPTR